MKLIKTYFESCHKTEAFPTLEQRVRVFEKRGQHADPTTFRTDWTLDRETFHKTRKAAKAAMKETN